MRQSLYQVILCVAVLLAIAAEGAAQPRKLIRKTRYGRVRGMYTELAQVFYGIPFAAPPERWTAPEEPEPWRGTLDAREAKPMCYQESNCNTSYPIDCVPEKSEDCLYLNIFAPMETRKSDRKAVLLFMPGGRFLSGTGAGLVYNAEEMVRRGDIIVVTINYRLGAFGFLSTGSSENDITGNYGLLDQKLAMKWVKRNIQKFGGDKEKITIAGQSAGAYSVGVHLTSGRADNLFDQAIMESTPFTIPLKTEAAAREQAIGFASQARCTELNNTVINITCLRDLSPDQIVYLQDRLPSISFSDSWLRSFMGWVPHIDGIEVKAGLIEALNESSVPPKPLMLGTVKDEGLLYVRGAFQNPVSVVEAIFVIALFVENAPLGIMALYPYTNLSDYREQLAEMATDYIFSCPNRLIARAQSIRMPVYTFDFQQPVYFVEAFENELYCVGRACHSVELPFVFQSARQDPFLFSEEEVALSDEMVTYWSNFVKYGNPNRDVVNGTRWVRFKPTGKESTIILEAGEDGIRNVHGFKDDLCDVWDTTGYQ